MADQVPLNTFKTEARALTTSLETVYTTPVGKTAIILGAMASNITDPAATVNVSFVLRKNSEDFIILDNFPVPPNDAAELTSGKLVVEQGSSIKAAAGANNSLNLVLSLLETSNE